MKHKVAELDGPRLDFAVGMAENECRPPEELVSLALQMEPLQCQHAPQGLGYCFADEEWPAYEPSTDWAVGGPIIERNRLWLSCSDIEDGGEWVASFHPYTETSTDDDPPETQRIFEGPTALIAAMRAFVASKFGEEIDLL